MICSYCHGVGTRLVPIAQPRGTRQVSLPCFDCGGSGIVSCCDEDVPGESADRHVTLTRKRQIAAAAGLSAQLYTAADGTAGSGGAQMTDPLHQRLTDEIEDLIKQVERMMAAATANRQMDIALSLGRILDALCCSRIVLRSKGRDQ